MVVSVPETIGVASPSPATLYLTCLADRGSSRSFASATRLTLLRTGLKPTVTGNASLGGVYFTQLSG